MSCKDFNNSVFPKMQSPDQLTISIVNPTTECNRAKTGPCRKPWPVRECGNQRAVCKGRTHPSSFPRAMTLPSPFQLISVCTGSLYYKAKQVRDRYKHFLHTLHLTNNGIMRKKTIPGVKTCSNYEGHFSRPTSHLAKSY